MRRSCTFILKTLVIFEVEYYTYMAILAGVFFLLDAAGLDRLPQKHVERLLYAKHARGYKPPSPQGCSIISTR